VVDVDREAMEARRADVVTALPGVPNFDPGNDERAFHGRAFCLAESSPTAPKVVWKSDKKPRQNSPDWLTATEYEDVPEVFTAKIKLLRQLLLMSRRTMAYTGAGLSVAAGIGMAAVGSKGGAGTGMGVATAGEPTLSHCVMAELNRQNLLHGWVQQNHDGLPQKAGYRQEDINEIHGSWFDPSNPVVKYSGSLRGDLYEDMESQADTADLVIVLGTSLTGLNADQCVRKTALRSNGGSSLGSVIISPQRTSQDGKCALRIFAKADDVMTALAKEFGFGPRAFGRGRGIRRSADLFPKETKVLVPYDKNGRRSTTVKTYWDLANGAKVRISSHNNIEGAKQPNDSGIKSNTVGTISGCDETTCSIGINIGGTNKKLGLWWLETAKRGRMEYLPIVNVDAKEMPA
jgi:NAD-dependent SIR2 family protein deacetylase